MTIKIAKFAITRFVKSDGDGPLRAFCDVSVGDLVLIRGIRVVKGRNGHFISMPRQLSKAGKWYDSVVPLTREVKIKIQQAVLDAFEAHNGAALTREHNA